MLHPCPTLLYDICVADAYGMGYEYVTDPSVRATNTLERYTSHPRHKNIAGTYTDDGQMSIAVALALEESVSPTRGQFVYWFLECFRRDPRRGYSAGFYNLLDKHTRDMKTGQRLKAISKVDIGWFLQSVRPTSTKNGAAMRAVPLGVLPTPEAALNTARLQASITHNTPEGIFAAQSVALMSHFAFYGVGDYSVMSEFCRGYLPSFSNFEKPWQGPVSGTIGSHSAHAAYTLLTSCKTRLEVLRKAVEFGGDTDTVAAIAFGIASIRMRDALPPSLVTGFESPNAKYGEKYLLALGERLMTKYA